MDETVWLVDFDGKIENLALMRLSAWHKRLGDVVRLKHGRATPELFETPDRVYISCLFSWNRQAAFELAEAWDGKVVLGGTGISPDSHLPPAAENFCIGYAQPDYDLYGRKRAIGFISRGCIRNCPWCIVPRKEGKLYRETDAEELVGDMPQATFLDNNFLALSDYFLDLEWLTAKGVAIDFNQGLDARLVTKDAAKLLARCRWLAGPRLALDSDNQILAVDRALIELKDVGIAPTQVMVYCLVGFWGLESDVRRLMFLRDWGVSVFPMGYRELETGIEPAKGWDRALYRKYRRLILRMPRARSVWKNFAEDMDWLMREAKK